MKTKVSRLPITFLNKVLHGFFLVVLNLMLCSIFGFLTLDSGANLNSRVAGLLLSILIPLLLVFYTRRQSGVERVLTFGSGLIAYLVLAIAIAGFPHAWVCGLAPCLLLALAVLFYGDRLAGNMERAPYWLPSEK